MKKLIICLLAFVFITFCFTAWQNKNSLDKYVSELKSDVFVGESENYSLKASYGYKETPFIHDGVPNEKVYKLTIKLVKGAIDGAVYTVGLSFNDKDYKSEFKLDPVSNKHTATIEIENFNLKEFDVSLKSSSQNDVITMKSIVPENTLTVSQALQSLSEKQNQLIGNYTDENGTFNGEIHARILVKNDHPYWYVGLVNKDKNLKALLIDGINGEVLAIREIL